MFNLKFHAIEKESALFADQMIRQYLWQYLSVNYQSIPKAKYDAALKVLNNPQSSLLQLNQTMDSLSLGTPSGPSDRATQKPDEAYRSEIGESKEFFKWQNLISLRPVRLNESFGFDAATNQVIFEGLSLAMLPNHERGLLQQAFGNYLIDSPDGIRFTADPNVYRKFQQYSQAFLPKGVKMPNAGDVKIDGVPLSKYLVKNDGTNIEALPFSKEVGATIEQGLVWDRNHQTSTALIVTLDPHSPILNGNDATDDLESFFAADNFPPKMFRIDPRGRITVFLNLKTKGEPDQSFKPSNDSLKTIAHLVDFLNKNGYKTQAITNVMSQYGGGLGTKLNTIETKERKAPLSDDEISKAVLKNQLDSMKKVAQHEGVAFNPKDPASSYQLVNHVSQKVRELYPNGFNNNIFPEEMKLKQAEAIALGVTRSSVVMADQPGSGKTFMSSAVAHYHTNMMDKMNGNKNQILVISPAGLIPQNWTTRPVSPEETPDPKKHVQVNGGWYTPSAPRQFLDPNMELTPNGSDQEIQVISDWGQQIGDARWVVMNYNLFTDAGDPREKEALLAEKKEQLKAEPQNKAQITSAMKGIKSSVEQSKVRLAKIKALIRDIQSRKFAVVMLDEAQMVKNDETRRSQYVHAAIAGISKVIAMTGTPADDNPSDLYGQLKLIKHPLIRPPGRTDDLDRTTFSDQFFGGFGVKGRNFDVQTFQDSIPQRVQETIKLLDVLAQFFVRREKEDINPLMFDKNIQRNPISKITDADGNEVSVDESNYPELRQQALDAAAWRKAAKQKASGKVQELDEDTQQRLHDMEEESMSSMDIDDLGDDDEYVNINGIQVSPMEQKEALAKITGNPAEEQQAVLQHMAMLKVPTTVAQAIKILNTEPNTVPPKVGEEIVVLDESGQVIDQGILQGFEPRITNAGLKNTREVFANVETANGVKQYPRKLIAPTNPQSVAKKVFIVTKSIDAAYAIKDALLAQLGDPNMVAVVSGKEADTGKRTEITEAFKDPKSPLRALVMTMKLGSVGFNFQVADTAIFNDISWNPSENEQASDRVYRISSPRDVNVVYNYLNIGEDAKMVSMVEAKDESNKKIQQCIKMAYEWKKQLLANPNAYNEKMAEAATQFLKELAESMRQHMEAKKIRGAAKRNTQESIPMPIPQEQQQSIPVAAKGWYNRVRIADDRKKPPPIKQNVNVEELAENAEDLLDQQKYEEAKNVVDQLVDIENAQFVKT